MPTTEPANTSLAPTEIDKLALLFINEKKVLSTHSKGKALWYLPGGKREKGENDMEALQREISEELRVEVDLSTIRYAGVYRAQADGHTAGIVVKMTCYYGSFTGTPVPSNEIDEFGYLGYEDRLKSSAVDQIIFEYLYDKGLIE